MVQAQKVKCLFAKSEILIWKTMKCDLQVTNKVFPWPAISWYKDGALLSSQDPRVTITSKKYVSQTTSKKYVSLKTKHCQRRQSLGCDLFVAQSHITNHQVSTSNKGIWGRLHAPSYDDKGKVL